MKYLICQEFSNTTNNHAGIKHMCNLLKLHYPEEYEVIVFPDLYISLKKNIFIRKFQSILIKEVIVPYKYLKIGKLLNNKLGIGDTIYLLEYFELLFPQLILAQYLRRKNRTLNIFGLVHLVPKKLEDSFSHSEMQKWIKPLSKILTLGTSLTDYFSTKLNIPPIKIRTLFHYVDLEYYKPLKREKFAIPKIIVMGNQKRNFELLKEIVDANLDKTFIICQGVMDLTSIFIECLNVELIGYVEEIELLKLMQNSDISLNVMDDTIGSNVITSSMAVGLAMVVSDVGSIRNYCKSDGAFYCNNYDLNSFTKALNKLCTDKKSLYELQEKSLVYSKELSIHKLHNNLCEI
ncbi:glycosyltransferase [Emticicia sp. BO119]|uniref:glycosyltransferase n=1 Tax=Emticicia sp. BO119 TaxID=2757768 RepID=UPI0015F1077B|nr:glycosyltransferase [Emticicia sp. BO119]MBA4850520.1 glycosyltransferase [Emticicia sp. BO119]